MDEKFKSLKEESEQEVLKLRTQLMQIDSTIEELEKKANFIRKEALNKIAKRLIEYLENKKLYEINDSQKKTGMVYFGTNYNNHADIDNADLTSWSIKAPDSSVMYSLNYNWDQDKTILKFIESWDWWHDYLIHRMDNFDGTYGIYQMMETMVRARNSIHGSILKYSQMETKLEEL